MKTIWTIYVSDGSEIMERGRSAVVVTRTDEDERGFSMMLSDWWIGETRLADPDDLLDITAIQGDQIKEAKRRVEEHVGHELAWRDVRTPSSYPYGWGIEAVEVVQRQQKA